MAKTTPLDLVNGSERTEKHIALERLNTCNTCPDLHLKICKNCGCFMPAKVKIAKAECPKGLWGES